MQRKLIWIYRGFLPVLFITAFWAVWANAQELNTNTPPAAVGVSAGTNIISSALERHGSEETFCGVDGVEPEDQGTV